MPWPFGTKTSRQVKRLRNEQQSRYQTNAQMADLHRWHLERIANFLHESPWITPATPHTEAWSWYLRWCNVRFLQPVSERDFAGERERYR
jgi:hypothetical protein